MIVCWRAGLERTEAAQKLALLSTEQGDVDKGFRPGEHREQTEKKDLVERVGYLALLARILQVFEIAQKNNRLVECGTIRRRVVHGCPPLSKSRSPMDSALYRVVTYSFTRLPCGCRSLFLPDSTSMCSDSSFPPGRPNVPVKRLPLRFQAQPGDAPPVCRSSEVLKVSARGVSGLGLEAQRETFDRH